MKKLWCICLMALCLLWGGAALGESKTDYYEQINTSLDSLESALASLDQSAANAAFTQVRNAVFAGAKYLEQIGEYNPDVMQIFSNAQAAINENGNYSYYVNQARGYNAQIFGNGASSGCGAVLNIYTVSIDTSIANGTVTLSDETARFLKNETVTLTVSPNAGYELSSLTYTPAGGAAVEITADDNGEYSFTMPAVDVMVSAAFRQIVFTVTVNGGTGSGGYAEGASVTIMANEPETGKQFKAWTGTDGLTFTNGSAATATATFSMPAHAVEVAATYEDIRYPITTTDGTAVALHKVGWLDWQPAAEAVAGETLELQIANGAEPVEEYYFTGEFAVNGVPLGVEYDENHLSSWPITEMTMPAEAISIKAVQAPRETVTLDFTQDAAQAVPCIAVVQLRNREDTGALFTMDDDWNEFIDLDGSGTLDLSVTKPDYVVTTADCTLTLLPGYDAFGTFAFAFSGPTDRYSPVTFILPAPAFGTPDFTLPAAIQAIEANAFEGIAASIVDVPTGCASIGDYAFKDCKSLTQIRIPEDCQLGRDVFDGCTLVYIFGTAGSSAETYCRDHDHCVFVGN